GHDEAGAGAAGEIAVGPCRVGGTLLVAHADIGDAFLLRSHSNRNDRKPDDPEQVIDALLLEASRDQGSAVDFAHGCPRDRLNIGRKSTHRWRGRDRSLTHSRAMRLRTPRNSGAMAQT